MNLNCNNCQEVLNKYLGDIPYEWRQEVIDSLCSTLEDEKSLVSKETLTSLSSFSRMGSVISITYKDELGKSYERSFNLNTVMDSSLKGIDPRCVATPEQWASWTDLQRVQAIIDFNSKCCPPKVVQATTTTTTSAPRKSKFTIHNLSGQDLPFAIILEDAAGTDYIVDQATENGKSSFYEYLGNNTYSAIIITHNPEVPVHIDILVDNSPSISVDRYTGLFKVNNITPKSDIVITLTSGIPTTTTSTTSTSTSTSTSTTLVPTTTTTTKPPRATTTTTTRLIYCRDVLSATITELNGSTTTTTTQMPPIACGVTGGYLGGEAFPTIQEVNLGSGTGLVIFDYFASDIPDKFIVKYNGQEVINTGYRGGSAKQAELDAALAERGLESETIQGLGKGMAYFNKTSTQAKAIVEVWAPLPTTGWTFTMSCPGQDLPGSTTSTTTVSDNISECTVLVLDQDSNVLTYEPSTGGLKQRILPITGYVPDIAHTTTKFWVAQTEGVKRFHEFNLTLSPFSIAFNRYIDYTTLPGAGMVAIDNNTLISDRAEGLFSSVYRYNISGNTAVETKLFELPDGYIVADMLYNSTDEIYLFACSDFLVPGNKGAIIQTSNTGVVQRIISGPAASDTISGLYQYNGELYGVGNSVAWKITDAGWVQTTFPVSQVAGTSQVPSCVTVKFGAPPTTTTTSSTTTSTTQSPTTTTTTTIVYYNYDFVPGDSLVQACAGNSTGQCGPVDIAFVLDTTESMQVAIDNLKNNMIALDELLYERTAGDYRLALITFKNGAQVEMNFAEANILDLQAALENIIAEEGGESPDGSNVAVNIIVNNLEDIVPFRDDANRLVILITDAPPGGTTDAYTQAQVDNVTGIALQALLKDIKVATILTAPADITYPGLPSLVAITNLWSSGTKSISYHDTSGGEGVIAGINAILAKCGSVDNTRDFYSETPTVTINSRLFYDRDLTIPVNAGFHHALQSDFIYQTDSDGYIIFVTTCTPTTTTTSTTTTSTTTTSTTTTTTLPPTTTSTTSTSTTTTSTSTTTTTTEAPVTTTTSTSTTTQAPTTSTTTTTTLPPTTTTTSTTTTTTAVPTTTTTTSTLAPTTTTSTTSTTSTTTMPPPPPATTTTTSTTTTTTLAPGVTTTTTKAPTTTSTTTTTTFPPPLTTTSTTSTTSTTTAAPTTTTSTTTTTTAAPTTTSTTTSTTAASTTTTTTVPCPQITDAVISGVPAGCNNYSITNTDVFAGHGYTYTSCNGVENSGTLAQGPGHTPTTITVCALYVPVVNHPTMKVKLLGTC